MRGRVFTSRALWKRPSPAEAMRLSVGTSAPAPIAMAEVVIPSSAAAIADRDGRGSDPLVGSRLRHGGEVGWGAAAEGALPVVEASVREDDDVLDGRVGGVQLVYRGLVGRLEDRAAAGRHVQHRGEHLALPLRGGLAQVEGPLVTVAEDDEAKQVLVIGELYYGQGTLARQLQLAGVAARHRL